VSQVTYPQGLLEVNHLRDTVVVQAFMQKSVEGCWSRCTQARYVTHCALQHAAFHWIPAARN
jgi:hypothetical protein